MAGLSGHGTGQLGQPLRGCDGAVGPPVQRAGRRRFASGPALQQPLLRLVRAGRGRSGLRGHAGPWFHASAARHGGLCLGRSLPARQPERHLHQRRGFAQAELAARRRRFATDSSEAGVPGGWRDIAMRSPGANTDSFYMSTTRYLQINRFASPTIYASLAYGQHAPMTLNIGGQSALYHDMIFAGGAVNLDELPTSNITLTICANTSNGVGLNSDSSALTVTLPKREPVTLPFSSFAMNSMTRRPSERVRRGQPAVRLQRNRAHPGDLHGTALNSISTVPVPEPGSWLLMLVGAVTLAARGAAWGKSLRVLPR